MTAWVYVLSCRLTSGPLWLGIYLFLWWFLLVVFGLFVLHWRYELPCQDKLPEFHYTPVLGCIRVLWLVFYPLGLGLDKALFGWNSVNALQAYTVMTSPTPNNTPQRSINWAHIHLFYHRAQAKQAQHGSLVDRGSNGGLAGSDVRVLSKSSTKCTVTGIGQHLINGLDIVQCAALVKTNHVYVDLIMNEYAYYGKGHTIHTSGKMEWHKTHS